MILKHFFHSISVGNRRRTFLTACISVYILYMCFSKYILNYHFTEYNIAAWNTENRETTFILFPGGSWLTFSVTWQLLLYFVNGESTHASARRPSLNPTCQTTVLLRSPWATDAVPAVAFSSILQACKLVTTNTQRHFAIITDGADYNLQLSPRATRCHRTLVNSSNLLIS